MGHAIEQADHLGGYWIGGSPGTYTPRLWDEFIRQYEIKSVLDIGCGEGHSTIYFVQMGLEVLGIEGGEKAVRNNKAQGHVIQHDYLKGSYKPSLIYDMGWCAEFVEHVDESYKANFLETFKSCKYLLMTHAVPGQSGYHHVNCQKADYWIHEMEMIGFTFMESESLRYRNLTDESKVLAEYNWTKKTLMIFKSNSL